MSSADEQLAAWKHIKSAGCRESRSCIVAGRRQRMSSLLPGSISKAQVVAKVDHALWLEGGF
jgi:hypothetical protein